MEPKINRGFSQVILLGIITVLILAGAGGFFVLREKKTPSFEKTARQEVSSQKTEEKIPLPKTQHAELPESETLSVRPKLIPFQKTDPHSPTKPPPAPSAAYDTLAFIPSCGDKKDFFSALPLNLADLVFIRPLGFIGSAPEHIYPTDHVYFFLKRGASNNAIEVPVYSPGDIWITKIKETKMERPIPNTTDYSIYFSPCKEFNAFYYHLSTVTEKIKSEIIPPFRYCHEEELGRFKQVACEKDVRIKLSAGELMGTVGQLDWQYSFDLGAYDLRTPRLDYANLSRWQEWQQHIVCPFDYFSQEVRKKLKAQLGENNILRTVEPICGEIEQDTPGTAEGVWFVKGAGKYARPELSLIHDFIDPSIGAFAFGLAAEKSGLIPNVLHFNPKSSGLVNRDFKNITNDSNIYCYDNLIKQWSEDKKPESLIVLIRLIAPSALRIEGKEAVACGSGPWQMSNYTELER